MFLAIFWPVVFHGTFDFFLFLGSNWLHFAGALISFIVAVRLSLKLIKQKQSLSQSHFINIDNNINGSKDFL